jgi:hypothetical protein
VATYYGFGALKTSRDGNIDEATEREKARTPLPDIFDGSPEHEAKYGEWIRSRSPTSHQAVGVEPGEKVRFIDAAGERRDAVILGEERDQHSGKVDVHLAANDPHGSGTYRLTFEGKTDRSMIETKCIRTHD